MNRTVVKAGQKMGKTIIVSLLKVILLPFIILFSPLFYLVAKTGIGVPITRKFGFQPIRVHYYQPIPEYESVPEDYFQTQQNFPGFGINLDRVTKTLKSLSSYACECEWAENQAEEGVYYTQNLNFGYSSAAILHSMIRASQSKQVVEIGSGFSSLITLEALKKNSPLGDFKFKCIEPFPSKWLAERMSQYPNSVDLLSQQAETVDSSVYQELNKNDILFIDSSHVSKLNSDVNFLYMQVLPRLKKGVIIHIHDIYIPYEYPKVHFYGQQKIFWNEQYILQAFLTNNKDFEIILPGYYVQNDMKDDFQVAFPNYNPQIYRATSSFWLRKVG
jgi:predicted O-methyltransferase YrrM